MSGLNPDTFADLLAQWRGLNSWDREDALSTLRFHADKLEENFFGTGNSFVITEVVRLRLAARLLQAAGETAK